LRPRIATAASAPNAIVPQGVVPPSPVTYAQPPESEVPPDACAVQMPAPLEVSQTKPGRQSLRVLQLEPHEPDEAHLYGVQSVGVLVTGSIDWVPSSEHVGASVHTPPLHFASPAQSVSLVQLVLHLSAVVSQAYLPHDDVVGLVHAPAPSQTAAGVSVLPEQEAGAQVTVPSLT
jgi:hypothetical protein